MARSQYEKGTVFSRLHDQGCFIIPNPWDVATAKLFELMGFEALATTSAGHANSIGMRDNAPLRQAVLEHAAIIAGATDLPVSADLGNGFGESPKGVAESIREAARAGVVGASIEDATYVPEEPIFSIEVAVGRIQAAAQAARALPFPFMLTARAENYLWKRPDLNDTIERLKAYEDAGADVLYAPGITSEDEIRRVRASVAKPINVLAGIPGFSLTRQQLAELGVGRVSTGSAVWRASMAAVIAAGVEMRDHGTFRFVPTASQTGELNEMIASLPAGSVR